MYTYVASPGMQEPEIRKIIRESEERERKRLRATVEPPILVIIREAQEKEKKKNQPVATPAPAVAEPLPAVPETQDIDEEDEPEETEIREKTVNGRTFRVIIRYSRSFAARVIQAPDALKNYYSEIKNELLAYEEVKSRISWKHEAFNCGRIQLAKLVVRGKNLCVYLALDPNAYEYEKYHQTDKSGKAAYVKVPMMIKVRSDLGLRKAKYLISEVMANVGLERTDAALVDYASWYAYRDTKTLVEENLIKELEAPEEPTV